MTCDQARRLLSDRLDDGLAPVDEDALERHLAGCEACAGYQARLGGIRRELRLASVGAPPDLAPRVTDQLRAGRRRRARAGPIARERARPLALAAVFLGAFALAATAVGLGTPRTAVADDVAQLVTVGQHRVERLAAEVEVTEHGWHPAVPVRRYAGTLRYAAPETFALELTDRTAYPGDGWRPNDIVLGVDGATSWTAGLRPCPVSALPGCTPATPDRTLVTGRAPFDAAEVSPLDLVVPVASLSAGGIRADLGDRTIADRRAVGVEVTVAQLAPLLDAVTATGNWRPLHPTDHAELWLDADTGVPLEVTVRAADTVQRVRWAAAVGYDDTAGAELLTWRVTALTTDPDTTAAPDAPRGASWQPVDRGFVDAAGSGLDPAWLPEGMTPHRRGHTGDVAVASFSDGRAWVTIRSTTSWDGERLFGAPAGPVERVPVGDGVGYASVGNRLHLHGVPRPDGRVRDVVVAGSVAPDVLRRIAASLDVVGRPVPAGWAEAPTTTLDAAAAALPGLLVPRELEGFRGPAVAVDGNTVSLGYVGGGDRAFVLTQEAGGALRPPLDDVVLGVEVRGVAGRFTPERGELEWVEDGTVVVLGSDTLSLEELLGVAATLRPAGGAAAGTPHAPIGASP